MSKLSCMSLRILWNKKTFFTEVEVFCRVGLQPLGIYVFMITESSCNLLTPILADNLSRLINTRLQYCG